MKIVIILLKNVHKYRKKEFDVTYMKLGWGWIVLPTPLSKSNLCSIHIDILEPKPNLYENPIRADSA